MILNEQVESGTNVVVAGDWNTAHFPIDLANPKANEKNSGFMPVERAQLDEYVENGYVDTFRLFHEEPENIHGGRIVLEQTKKHWMENRLFFCE